MNLEKYSAHHELIFSIYVAPNLAISLKEWLKVKSDGTLEEWHFGLIAHAPGAVPDTNDARKAFPLYHWTIDTEEK